MHYIYYIQINKHYTHLHHHIYIYIHIYIYLYLHVHYTHPRLLSDFSKVLALSLFVELTFFFHIYLLNIYLYVSFFFKKTNIFNSIKSKRSKGIQIDTKNIKILKICVWRISKAINYGANLFICCKRIMLRSCSKFLFRDKYYF